MNSSLLKKQRRSRALLSVSFAILSVVYLLPIAIVLMNSFKSNASINTATFALPNEQTWMGLQNYIKGMTFGNYPFWKSVLFSLLITVVSTFLILLCTDCSVIAIDGISVTQYTIPALTTMVQPAEELGRGAVTTLIDLIDGRSGNRHITLEAVLREGESVRDVR